MSHYYSIRACREVSKYFANEAKSICNVEVKECPQMSEGWGNQRRKVGGREEVATNAQNSTIASRRTPSVQSLPELRRITSVVVGGGVFNVQLAR
jgi:hypothetical protein